MIEKRLAAAECAYHELLAGSAGEVVNGPAGPVTYTVADIGQLRTLIGQLRLAVAERAYSQLAAGAREQTVQIDNRSVTYTQTTMADLKAYIDVLRQETAPAAARRSRITRLVGGRW